MKLDHHPCSAPWRCTALILTSQWSDHGSKQCKGDVAPLRDSPLAQEVVSLSHSFLHNLFPSIQISTLIIEGEIEHTLIHIVYMYSNLLLNPQHCWIAQLCVLNGNLYLVSESQFNEGWAYCVSARYVSERAKRAHSLRMCSINYPRRYDISETP